LFTLFDALSLIVQSCSGRVPSMRTSLLGKELEAVLASGNASRRVDILNRIADLFLYGAERYSPDQISLFDDVIGRLLTVVDIRSRARLAERLAPIANAPAGVIRTLALDDEIAVAGSVLAHSAQLGERDLVAIARSKSKPHLLAIARRDRLSATVTDALVERGDRDVLTALARNDSARFSTAGCRQLLARTAGPARPASAPAFEAKPKDRLPPDEAEIYRSARDGKLVETANALSLMSGIPNDAVERALLNPRAEALLVFARAAGLSSITTEAILRLRAADCGMSAEDVAAAMAKFTRLPRDSARRVLSFFRIRLEKPALTAPAPVVAAQ
jgi:uncharacterized protein (DUF2336 family)